MRVKQAAIVSEEMESPTYTKTAAVGCGKKVIGGGGGGLYLPLHSQIRRIRDEESHVGEDMYWLLNLLVANEYKYNNSDCKALKAVLLSRPILPASPLGGIGKTAANNKFAD